MQTIPNFTSLSAPQTRQVTWMPSLLLTVVLRRSGVGCVRINYCWTRKKTEFLSVGTKQQLVKVDIGHIKVGKVNIAPHFPIKNLGVWFDSNLSMVDHITKTCSAAFYYLCNIRRIRKYLKKECTETLIHAFISSRLDYCNSLLFGVPECHLHKLKRVQKAAARLIFQDSRFCHTTPLLKSLHWLSVKYRIVFKIISITFKAIHYF